MQSLESQFFAFLMTVLIGFMTGVSFDVYNFTKMIIRPRKIWAHLGDILFWVFATVNIIFLLLIGNWGEMRLYVLIGVGLGAALYFRFFRTGIRKMVYLSYRWLGRMLQIMALIFRYVRMTVVFPVVFVGNVFMVPLRWAGLAGNTMRVLAKRGGAFLFNPVFRRLAGLRQSVRNFWKALLKR